MSALLAVEDLNKRFGGLHAVKNVSLSLMAGTITGILGPNGAGKTTLFNLLTGFLRPDDGRVTFDGQPITGLAPHRIVNRGLARTFQLARPFVGMSVAENIEVACLAPRVSHLGRPASARSPSPISRAWRQGGTGCRRPALWRPPPPGIARALATAPKLLLLDEPFAGLGAGEVERLAELIRALHKSEHLTILIIEHKLREFMQVVQEIIAMDFGEIIARGAPAEIVRHPRVVEAYLGTAEIDLDLQQAGAGRGAA